jgi:hypothetical protein
MYTGSLEYVTVTVTSSDDLSGTDAEIAFVPVDQPPPDSDFRTPATWDGVTATILVGPPDFELIPGVYAVWVRIVDAPEIPVFKTAQKLTITRA